MTDFSHPDPTDQAISWQIRLADAPDDATLQAAIQDWRAAHAENDRAWRKAERVRQLAALAMQMERSPRSARETSVTPLRPRPKASAWKRVPPFAAAAAIAAFALIGGPDLLNRLRADYVTGAGDLRHIALADGSDITMGAGTAIAVRYTDDVRTVTLLKGEAFFRVKHDSARVFTVRAGAVTLRDIGTQFDVRKSRDHLTLAVRDGLVGLSAPTSHVIDELRVKAGEEIELTDGSANVIRRPVDPDTVGSWSTGQFTIDSISIADLTEVLKRYSRGYVILRGPVPASVRVGGVYDLTHPVESFRMIATAHHGTVSEYGPYLTIVNFASEAKPN